MNKEELMLRKRLIELSKISKTLIHTPIQCADKRYDNKFLAEIRDKLHKFIKKRSSYSF